MTILRFSDRSAFYDWLLGLPDDLLTIDGDYIVFQFSGSGSDVDSAIDRLLAEFSSFERNKEGKV